MKWEKLVERKGDFLKNCLIFEGLRDNFYDEFKTNFSDLLLIRHDDIFIHYVNHTRKKLINIIRKNGVKKIFDEGKKHFMSLVQNASKANFEQYFKLYKRPYPYFVLSIEGQTKQEIELMSKLRFIGRSSFERAHELILPEFERLARKNMTKVDKIKYLTPTEILQLEKGDKINIDQKILDRKHCAFLYHEGSICLFEKTLINIQDNYYSQLKGLGTIKAKIIGEVKIINEPADMKDSVNKIIVTRMTTPQLTIGIDRVKAIITNEGGITCHAALISREYKIPALIGTKNATSILKDGNVIELDTTNGVVKILK